MQNTSHSRRHWYRGLDVHTDRQPASPGQSKRVSGIARESFRQADVSGLCIRWSKLPSFQRSCWHRRFEVHEGTAIEATRYDSSLSESGRWGVVGGQGQFHTKTVNFGG